MNALERIRELLLKYNWSKYELAKRANVPQGTINQMFSRNYQPSISTLESICRGFGISMAEFFAEEETERHLTAEQVMQMCIRDRSCTSAKTGPETTTSFNGPRSKMLHWRLPAVKMRYKKRRHSFKHL